MYSRSTDRGGRRIKLPPGYDGNAFRHDTGEIRRLGGETEMKIHSPAESVGHTGTVEGISDDAILRYPQRNRNTADRKQQVLPGQWREMPDTETADGVEDTDRTEAGTDSDGEKGMETVPKELYAEEKRENAVSGHGAGSLLEGLLGSLGSEDWLLFLVVLLLVADGSDAWDLILLLGVLLAVK